MAGNGEVEASSRAPDCWDPDEGGLNGPPKSRRRNCANGACEL